MLPTGFRADYCFNIEHPKPDLKPPTDSIREPDRLFNDLYTSADSPGSIARRHNITLNSLIAFASSPATRDKLAVLQQIAHDRADIISCEARVAAALVLQRCIAEEAPTESARLAASIIFRSPCHRLAVLPLVGVPAPRQVPVTRPPSKASRECSCENHAPQSDGPCARAPVLGGTVAGVPKPASDAPADSSPQHAPRSPSPKGSVPSVSSNGAGLAAPASRPAQPSSVPRALRLGDAAVPGLAAQRPATTARSTG